MDDALVVSQGDLGLIVKLASMVVHLEELVGPGGHYFDQIAFDSLRQDPEVLEAMEQLQGAALLPVKRRKP